MSAGVCRGFLVVVVIIIHFRFVLLCCTPNLLSYFHHSVKFINVSFVSFSFFLAGV